MCIVVFSTNILERSLLKSKLTIALTFLYPQLASSDNCATNELKSALDIMVENIKQQDLWRTKYLINSLNKLDFTAKYNRISKPVWRRESSAHREGNYFVCKKQLIQLTSGLWREATLEKSIDGEPTTRVRHQLGSTRKLP